MSIGIHLYSPKTKLYKHGLVHKVWEVNSQADFEAECFSLASQLVNQEVLGASIEQVTQMRRYDENNRQFLVIHLFATGVSNELIINVPKY